MRLIRLVIVVTFPCTRSPNCRKGTKGDFLGEKLSEPEVPLLIPIRPLISHACKHHLQVLENHRQLQLVTLGLLAPHTWVTGTALGGLHWSLCWISPRYSIQAS